MKPDEYAKIQAELDAELRLAQKLQSEYQPVKPLEVEPYTPYIDSDNFKHGIQAIQKIREAQEVERQARIKSEERAEKANRRQVVENRIWQTIIVLLGILSLAVGVLGLLN